MPNNPHVHQSLYLSPVGESLNNHASHIVGMTHKFDSSAVCIFLMSSGLLFKATACFPPLSSDTLFYLISIEQSGSLLYDDVESS